MCNWKKWIWPGLVTTALLTALTGWFLAGRVHHDLGLRASDQLNAGQPWAKIAFSGRDGAISGIAENEIQQREAASIAKSTYGVRVVENRTTLPPKADPFVISLIKAGEGITLKGNYTSTESRIALVGALEKAMPGIAIKDELTLASGKPDGFDGLTGFGVAQLADLGTGEVSLSNLDYAIKGEPVNLDVYGRLTAATAALPSGGVLKLAEIALPALGKPYEISSTYDGNGVTLEGYAPSLDAKAAVEAKTKELFPGKAVNNLLKLASGAPDGYADWVGFGLGQIAALKQGAFAITGTDYALKGVPADAATFEAAMMAAKDALPSGLKLAAADLVAPPAPPAEPEPAPAPEPAKPYVWTAANSANGVKLEGSVPTQADLDALTGLAKSRFVKSEVTAAQIVRADAPDGIAAVQSGLLKALTYLSDGTAVITDKDATLTGTSPSQTIADLVVRKAQSVMSDGYKLTTDIKVVEPEMVALMVKADPYVWGAVSNASGITLDGSVLSGAVGKSLIEKLNSVYTKGSVASSMAPRNPSPAGFAAAQASLLQGLAALNEGKASLNDNAASLTGVAANEDVKAAVIKSVTEALPGGYELASEISVVPPPPAPEPAPAPEPTPAPAPDPKPAPAPEPAPEPAPTPVPDPNACIAEIAGILSQGQINFQVSKAIIRDDSKETLVSIADALKSCPAADVEIGGHTDSDGNEVNNQSLSEARAIAVRDVLVQSGLDGAKITAKGYGESQPIADNDNRENKAKNRRIEFRLVQ